MRAPSWKVSAAVAALACVLISLAVPRAARGQSASLGTLDAKGPIDYFIAEGKGQIGYRPRDPELARWALAAWQRSLGKTVRFQPVSEPVALIRLYWIEPNEGTYGEMRPLTVGGRRGAAVFIQPDVESLGPDIAQRAREDALLRDSIVYLTCLHELGHALGLPHTRDFRDIMYFFGYGGNIVEYFNRYRAQLRSRSDIATVSGLSDADINHIRALYAPE